MTAVEAASAGGERPTRPAPRVAYGSGTIRRASAAAEHEREREQHEHLALHRARAADRVGGGDQQREADAVRLHQAPADDLRPSVLSSRGYQLA